MPKTRRTKPRKMNPPITRAMVVANAIEVVKGHGREKRERLVTVITGAPRGKVYPYGSAGRGYGKAPRVVRKEPALAMPYGADAS